MLVAIRSVEGQRTPKMGPDPALGQGRQACLFNARSEEFTIDGGYLTMHPSGGYLTFTQAGADLFA
jgi:hypothetical protein